jgi:IPT/TIG domain
MAQVRMHSPPAREVKRTSFRWARQRPITRGHADDHAPLPTPTITSLAPSSVPHDVPTLVTITGTNFLASISDVVVDGDAYPTGTYVSPTTMTFMSTASAAGTQQVVVTNGDVSSSPSTLTLT